jgi:2-polyprenyl-3-methyl-5-hydroxy-6-metoxy-1,4-benzoquinol methylase
MPYRPVMKSRNRCPGCLSDSLSVVYEESYGGPGIRNYMARHYEGNASSAADACSYELVRCNSCTLAFQKHVPDDRLLDEIYNGWVPGTELDRTHRNYSLDDYRYLAEQVQYVIQYFGVPPGELSVLDFGFGWAHWSRMAMAYGCDVYGVELSEERLRHGQSVGIKVVELADLPAKKFRFIHTEQVFEHLTEPRAVLERLVQALAVDGLIKISVPNAGPSLKKLARHGDFSALSPAHQMPIAPLEHVNAFNHDSLVAFGKTLGLKPVRPNFFKLYNSASGLLAAKNLARVLARPFYRHIFPRSTFVYFEHA